MSQRNNLAPITSQPGNGIPYRDKKTAPRDDYAAERSLNYVPTKLFYRNRFHSQGVDNIATPTPLSKPVHLNHGHLSKTSINCQKESHLELPRNGRDHWVRSAAPHVTHQRIPVCPPAPSKEDPMDGKLRTPKSVLSYDQDNSLFGIHDEADSGLGVDTRRKTTAYITNEGGITSELYSICGKIQDLLDTRHQYLRLSLQRPGDNPKDSPEWVIYPPPPEPVWNDLEATGALSNNLVLPSTNRTGSQSNVEAMPNHSPRKSRKLGQDIGEDFILEDLPSLPPASDMSFELDGGSVYQVYESTDARELNRPLVKLPSLRDFYMDLDKFIDVSTDGPVKSFAFKRLSYLDGKFQLHALLNEYQEIADSKKVPHRDFYNVRKVDTHVHHSACMNQKHLLRFIKSKMRKSPDEVVLFRDNKHLTLQEVFESINLTAYDLSIDTLDMHVSTNRFQGFRRIVS